MRAWHVPARARTKILITLPLFLLIADARIVPSIVPTILRTLSTVILPAYFLSPLKLDATCCSEIGKREINKLWSDHFLLDGVYRVIYVVEDSLYHVSPLLAIEDFRQQICKIKMR